MAGRGNRARSLRVTPHNLAGIIRDTLAEGQGLEDLYGTSKAKDASSGIFQRLNPHVKDIDRIRPGQVVDIPLKKLVQGTLPGQSSGLVTIPFVMINKPREMIQKHARSYTIQRGDTVSKLP